MIFTQYPSRIGLAGGSTDQQEFIDKFGSGMVINFPANIYNKIIVDCDKLGKNSYDNKIVVIYSQREECNTIEEVKNDIVKFSLENKNVKPFTTIFLSDINSVGSGLACSSAYTLAFNHAMETMQKKFTDSYTRCVNAYNIEKKFNPYLGMQDTFGCGIPALKVLFLKKDEYPKIETIKTKVFDDLDMYLLYTGISRKSTNVLKTLHFKDDSLLKICEKFYNALQTNNTNAFLKLIRDGWLAKKNTSSLIVQESSILDIDNMLEQDKTVLAHRLCGAGNGGYFLLFVKKGIIPSYQNAIKINIVDTFSNEFIL